MSKALKCNRCNKCFDPLDQGYFQMVRFLNPIYQSPDDMRERKVSRYFLEDESAEAYVDLCPECTGQFTLFMEGSPLAMKANDFDKPDIKKEKYESSINEQQKELLGKLKAIGQIFYE